MNALARIPSSPEYDPYDPLFRMGCGALAACIANAATYPMDVLRARTTLGGESTQEAFTKVLAERSMFRGLGATLCAVAPFVAVQNSTIDVMRATAADYVEVRAHHIVACGAVSGAFAQTLVYPLDVLRRRVQMAGGLGAAQVASTLRRGGVSALFAGITAAYLKVVPAVATGAVIAVSLNGHFRETNAAKVAQAGAGR